PWALIEAWNSRPRISAPPTRATGGCAGTIMAHGRRTESLRGPRATPERRSPGAPDPRSRRGQGREGRRGREDRRLVAEDQRTVEVDRRVDDLGGRDEHMGGRRPRAVLPLMVEQPVHGGFDRRRFPLPGVKQGEDPYTPGRGKGVLPAMSPGR